MATDSASVVLWRISTFKKIAAAILAILSAASFHDLCLTLVADVTVPGGSLGRHFIGLAFFGAIALGGAAGAAKIWDRWRVAFGISAIATALATAQLTMMSHPGAALTARDKAAAYVTMALVAAVGALALFWAPRRSVSRRDVTVEGPRGNAGPFASAAERQYR